MHQHMNQLALLLCLISQHQMPSLLPLPVTAKSRAGRPQGPGYLC